MAELLKMIPTKPDAELAEDFKKRLMEVYAPVLSLLDEINAAGFQANINTAFGPLGKQAIAHLAIIKVY